MNKKIICIIPARMGSSRFPGKPMAEIHGMPMIGHVYHRCKLAQQVDEVYVATCDQVIFDYVESIGGKAVMTADSHERCTDRTSEALLKIEAATDSKFDIVIMVQGDEPMVFPEMLNQSVQPMLIDTTIKVVNLMGDLKTDAEFEDPNEVKVVCDLNNNALYFSREAIPSRKKSVNKVPARKQVCVIPFQRDFLIEFNSMESTPLEVIESVDMMRILEHGLSVKMVPTEFDTYAVDTKADLEQVEKLMQADSLMVQYNL